MLPHFAIFIHAHILPLGAWGVFIAAFIEEVFAFIPSAFVLLGAGFLFVHGPITAASLATLFMKISLPGAIGVTIGSLVGYAIAYFAGKPVLERWGKWIGLSWSDVEKLHARFSNKKFDIWTLFMVRALPIVPNIVVSAFSGLVRFPFWPYIIISFFGFIIRTTMYGFIGWQVGKLYFRLAARLAFFQDAVALVIVLAVLGFIVWRIMCVRKKTAPVPQTSHTPQAPRGPQDLVQ